MPRYFFLFALLAIAGLVSSGVLLQSPVAMLTMNEIRVLFISCVMAAAGIAGVIVVMLSPEVEGE